MRKLTVTIPERFEISEPLRAHTNDLLTLPVGRLPARASIPLARQALARKLEEVVRARRGANIHVALLPSRDD